ncbi:MAG: LolA family protein [Thermoanaerobaculia bacterium]
MRTRRRIAASLLLLVVLPFAPGASPPSSAQDAASLWAVLDSARESLAAAGAEQADFVQTYVPAGFSTGEEEAGRVAFRLPDCLRWDYDEPYPKSFLLCGEEVYSWNPEDRRGQVGEVDRERQPGLDLLLLPVDELSGRYEASIAPAEDRGSGEAAGPAPSQAATETGAAGEGRVAVHLEPRAGLAAQTELTQATLVVDTTTDRLVEVSYQDREGNRTTFRLSDYRALEDPGLFEPPEGIDWEEG